MELLRGYYPMPENTDFDSLPDGTETGPISDMPRPDTTSETALELLDALHTPEAAPHVEQLDNDPDPELLASFGDIAVRHSGTPTEPTEPTDTETIPVIDDPLRQLVEAAKEGDGAAFDALVRQTHTKTYNLAYELMGDAHDAQDVTQEVYLRVYRGIGRFRQGAQFTTWLYRITANCASTHLSKRSRHTHERLEYDPNDDTENSYQNPANDHPQLDPEANLDSIAHRSDLQVALGELSPALRAVVVLFDIYDLSHEQIAERLGIGVSASKLRLHRARHKLRKDLYPLPDDEE